MNDIYGNDFCMCGHTKLSHSNNYDFPLCEECANNGFDTNWEHDFKLDNLKLIEELAKERGL